MNEAIFESGMTFGPFGAGQCFHIEKSSLYKKLGEGVWIVEFALLRSRKKGQAVWMVEAKSSSPQPATVPDFDQFIAEITQKMSQTLQLLLAALLGRHAETTELSPDFKTLDLENALFVCVLVINGHDESWLVPLKDALEKALKPLVKSMALGAKAVVVINDVMAREYGLIN